MAENKQNTHQPFGFLATYTSRLSAKARAQHIPLGRAIEEFSGAGNKNALLTLLKPVQKAAENSPHLKDMVDAGEIFHPLAWTAEEAYRFLKDIPAYEAAGVVVRVPDWWRAKRPPRPQVNITVGKKGPSGLGLEALMDFRVSLTLGDETLSEAPWREILRSTSGLVSIKGRWVEIDKDKLREVLDHWRHVEASVAEDGISFSDGMRLLAGASGLTDGLGDVAEGSGGDWCRVVAGDWLARTLADLRSPEGRAEADPGRDLKATLRPYQRAAKNATSWYTNSSVRAR